MDWSLQELLNGLASKCYRLFSAERGDAGAQFNLDVRYDQAVSYTHLPLPTNREV